MSRRRRSFSESKGTDEINISPLIDMVFILLIFFIVTTVFVEETGVEVNKPPASTAIDLESNSILLAITDDGKVMYGGRDIGITGVRPTVRRLLQAEKMPVIIQADTGIQHGVFARVYDEVQLAGAKKISFSTEG